MRKRFLLLAFLLSTVVFQAAGHEWYGDIPAYYHQKIIDTITVVQRKVHDVNGDGKVNCIDHAVMFKSEWDKAYPENKFDCRIARNKNGNVMHHLFIQIYYSDYNYVLVEPWASDPRLYKMEDNWNWKYDPRYNIYGETDRWLRTCHLYTAYDDGRMYTYKR